MEVASGIHETGWKGYLRRSHPRTYRALVAMYGRVAVEYRVLRHLRWSMFARAMVPAERMWRKALPLQAVTRLHMPVPDSGVPGDLLATLGAGGVPVAHGGHTFYLSPDAWSSGPLAAFRCRYPADAGLKVMRTAGGIGDAPYAVGHHHSRVQLRLMYGHPHLLLVANALHRAGVGPRLYDVVELMAGDTRWVGYVVQHVAERPPTQSECETGIRLIRQLVVDGTVAVVVPGGLQHDDFRCPACGGNAWIGADGKFYFVDFQNFVLPQYARQLRRIAKGAAEDSHFGDRSFLRGGGYLYQSVPGVKLPAKRDIMARVEVLQLLLSQAGVSLQDRVVLDVGCNIGMMIGQYLRLGARWCHGWDREPVVAQAEPLLSALGCTRVSVSGVTIDQDRKLADDLPEFLRGQLEGCVVSYLAVRGHLGWIQALKDLPWTTMIYEGHEGETVDVTRVHLADFEALSGARIAALTTYRDGDSEPRVLAVMSRP